MALEAETRLSQAERVHPAPQPVAHVLSSTHLFTHSVLAILLRLLISLVPLGMLALGDWFGRHPLLIHRFSWSKRIITRGNSWSLFYIVFMTEVGPPHRLPGSPAL